MAEPRHCADCGNELPVRSRYCPSCGKPSDADADPVRRRRQQPAWRPATVIWTVVMLAALGIGSLWLLNGTRLGASVRCHAFGDAVACVQETVDNAIGQPGGVQQILQQIGNSV